MTILMSDRRQFTLNGRVCSKGKVDFAGSMPPSEARDFYDGFLAMVKAAHASDLVKDGLFGAKMEVSLVNDGPITVIIDSSEMDKKKEGAGRSGAADLTSEPAEGARGEK